MSTITESIRRLTAKFGRVPCLDATTDLKVKASSHRKLRRKLDRVDGLLEHIPLHKECGAFRAVWLRCLLCYFSGRAVCVGVVDTMCLASLDQ